MSNTIPIYCGAPDIHDFFNNNAFINIPSNNIDTFNINIIEKLATDENKYIEILETNKIKPEVSALVDISFEK